MKALLSIGVLCPVCHFQLNSLSDPYLKPDEPLRVRCLSPNCSEYLKEKTYLRPSVELHEA